MMLYDSVYRQVISLSSQVACCFSTEQTCGWLASPDVLFHWKIFSPISLLQNWSYVWIRRRTRPAKKHDAQSFCCTHQTQWKNHLKNVAQKKLSPQDRRLHKIHPKAQSLESGTKNQTNQKSTGKNPPINLFSQFFLGFGCCSWISMVFPMFLGYSSVFPKLFHLFSPGVGSHLFSLPNLGTFWFSMRFIERDQTFQILRLWEELFWMVKDHPEKIVESQFFMRFFVGLCFLEELWGEVLNLSILFSSAACAQWICLQSWHLIWQFTRDTVF